jgi:hypothetical protein
MALVAGNHVITYSTIADQLGEQSLLSGGGAPMIGVVESNAGGNLIIDWANGTRSTLASVAGEAQLLQLAPVSASLQTDYYHRRVQVTFGGTEPGDKQGQSVAEGLVIGGLTLAGTPNVDYVVVLFSGGDIAVVPAGAVTVLDTSI